MTIELGEFDRRLLRALMAGVPFARRPFDQLAGELGVSPQRVLARVGRWTAQGGIVRDIGASFELGALGYRTTLVAALVAAEALDEAGRIVAGHPGVSHCYGRRGPLNLWFTLAVGPDSVLGLERTVGVLGEMIQAERVVSLPPRRRYKLDVQPMLGGTRRRQAAREALVADGRPGRPVELGPEELGAVRALCRPLPALREPFDELAAGAGMDVEELLRLGSAFLSAGLMRRYGAALRHRLVGAESNVLVAWRVPPDRADVFGARLARFEGVSHCFLRQGPDDWPYNLYTMVHGANGREVAETVAAMAVAVGGCAHLTLPTAREYKKARLQLFSGELPRWEAAVVG